MEHGRFFWQKKSAQYPGEYISFGDNSSQISPHWLIRTDASGASNDYLGIAGRNDAGTEQGWTSVGFAKINNSQWHLITVTGSSGSFSAYIDGANVAQSTNTFSGTYNNIDWMTVGALRRGVAIESYYSGSLDDVRIYSRALGAAEIKRMYQQGSAKRASVNTTGLVGYWRFNEERHRGRRRRQPQSGSPAAQVG